MNIIELKAENIKRIKAVEIKPDSNFVEITGKNAAGKSSLLDSIAYALGGKKLIPEDPISHGKNTASIRIDLGSYIVERNWTKSGNTYLKVSNKDGMQAQNAQSLLDGLIGNLSFDPMKYCSMEPKKRLELLKKITGLDFTEHDQSYKLNFENRSHLKKELAVIEARIGEYQDLPDIFKVRSWNEVVEEKNKSEEIDRKRINAQHEIKRQEERIKAFDESIDNYHTCIAEYEEKILGYENQINHAAKEMNKAKSVIAEQRPMAEAGPIDFSALTKEFYQIQTNRELETKHKIKAKYEKDLSFQRGAIETSSAKLKEIEEQKKKEIREAKLPVEGLEFGESDIHYLGVPFGQASSAEKIKISMAMAMALNSKIKIIRIMNGSLLDAKAKAEIESIAKDKGFQIWIETVADSPDGNSIYIEEGYVL